ncbi:unnamed protein product [Prunus armeniaca]
MDVHVLGTREDNRVVTDVMALSMQSATSVASMGHRQIVKSHEVLQVLRTQLQTQQSLVKDC